MEALRRIALGTPRILPVVDAGRREVKTIAAAAITYVDVSVADPNGVGTSMALRGTRSRDSAPATAV